MRDQNQWQAAGVVLEETVPGFPLLKITNRHAKASLSLYGGHVLSYQPNGHRDLLWLSSKAVYQEGRSIRGGIPLCWPWFGPHPEQAEWPSHGFARHRRWRLDTVRTLSDESSELRLSLPEPKSEAWREHCELALRVTVGERLQVALTTRNTGENTFHLSAALHSYFAVSDIGAILLTGLDDTVYRDALDNNRCKRQQGDIRFEGELDRVYRNTAATVIIDDPGYARRISVAKRGSRSTVVWNPWLEKSARLGDFTEGGYRQMVCVETANADDDRVMLAAGESHTLTTEIGLVDSTFTNLDG